MTGVVTSKILTESVEERAAMSAALDVKLRQITQGHFEGQIETAKFGDVGLYQDRWSQLTSCSGAIAEDRVLFAATTDRKSTIDWCGVGVREHRMAIAKPQSQVDFIIPANTAYVALVLPTSRLRATFGDAAVDMFLKSEMPYAGSDPDKGRQFLNSIQSAIHAGFNHPEPPTCQANWYAIEMELIDDLAELGIFMGDQKPIRQPALRAILKKALLKAESYRERVTVPQFAAQLDVGQRNLELAFKRHLGITPRRYLTYCRMHQVYRELRFRSPDSHCVTDVASAWGFTELGRFSGEYCKLFGELPSTTLQRPPLRRGHHLLDPGD